MNEMNDCGRAGELFDAALDGELGESERAFLEEHLAKCETCRAEYARYRQTVNAIRGTAPDIPAELHTMIMKKIGRKPRRAFVIPHWLRAAGGVCAAALLCVAILRNPLGQMASKSSDNAKAEAMYSAHEDKSDIVVDGYSGANGKKAEESDRKAPLEGYETALPDAGVRLEIYTVKGTDFIVMPGNDGTVSVFRNTGNGQTEFLLSVSAAFSENRLELKTDTAFAAFVVEGTVLTPTEGDITDILNAGK